MVSWEAGNLSPSSNFASKIPPRFSHEMASHITYGAPAGSTFCTPRPKRTVSYADT